MARVPLHKGADLTNPQELRSFFDWYSKELKKDPNYGSRRSARDKKRREYIKKKKSRSLWGPEGT